MTSPRDTLRFSRKRASFAKAVGSFVPGLTRKSFEKYGFSTATLLTDWTIIAGKDLASFTLPERLKWPRNVEAFEETKDDARGRPGATLVLRVDGPRAIEVQYQTGQIIERINAHFGYRAVSEIRFIQAPIDKRTRIADPRAKEIAAQRRRVVAAQTAAKHETATDQDVSAPDPLLAALDRLHANMTRARP
ncbi:MAG: hypothetical protein ACI9XZ_001264 [Alphaproteobacteria bacterium]